MLQGDHPSGLTLDYKFQLSVLECFVIVICNIAFWLQQYIKNKIKPGHFES